MHIRLKYSVLPAEDRFLNSIGAPDWTCLKYTDYISGKNKSEIVIMRCRLEKIPLEMPMHVR